MSRDPSSPAPGGPDLGGTSAWRRIRDFLLRGGRLTKVAGEAASYAPSVGRAAPAALGAFAGLVARASGAGRAAASASMLGILAGTFLALSASEALSHREYRKFLGSDNCHNHPNSIGSNHEEFWCIGPANTPQLVSVSNRAVNLVLGENANQSNIENVFNIYDGSLRALEIVQSGSGGITVTRGPNRRVSMTSYGTVLRAVNRGVGNITISLSNATLRKSKNTDDSVVRIINEDAAGGSVTLNLGTISIGTGGSGAHGNGHGLYITNNGSGTTTISASGHIVGVGRGGDGIRVRGTGSSAASDSISISVATVTGGRAGIDVTHRGGGDVSIRATGAVTGNNGYGIVLGKNGGGSTAITVSGPVTSSRDGIRVNDGVARSAATASLTISVASVTGAWMGMRLEHRGGGNVSIRATGTVTGRGGADEGISVKNFTGDSSVTISAASVVAQGTHDGADAIAVEQKADGDVAVTVSGAVSTAGGRGIFVDNDGDGDVTIVADASGASVSRGGSHRKDAIRVENAGSGAVDISVRGVSAGGSGYHAIAVDSEGRGDVTVTIRGTVTAGGSGFGLAPRAVHLDTPSGAAGRITLKSGAVVKGVIEDGGADTELIVESGAKLEQNVILGAGDDTFALNRREDFTGKNVNLGAGTDTLRIDFSIGVHPADFLTDFASSWEILHLGRGGHLRKQWTIARSNVPINVFHKFSFDVPVRDGNDGMKLTQTGRGGITLTQSGGFMRAGQYPIAALNSGEGDVSVTLAGEVKTHDRSGNKERPGVWWENSSQGLVHAENKDASGGDVWVAVGSVQASTISGRYEREENTSTRFQTVIYVGGGLTEAVWAKNQGTGSTTVIAKGKLRSGSLRGDGVKVETGSLTTSVDVSVRDVETRNTGISISHKGTGNVSVTASGTIETRNHSFLNKGSRFKYNGRYQYPMGPDGPGIGVNSVGPVRVSAATITATTDGIRAGSSRGSVSINATGLITANRDFGIVVRGSTSITVSAKSITSGKSAIDITSLLSGTVHVTATGLLRSKTKNAVYINSWTSASKNTKPITVNLASLTAEGGSDGQGSDTSQRSLSQPRAFGHEGLGAGVAVSQHSQGSTSITVTGPINASGGDGVFLNNYGSGSIAVKTLGDVISGRDGISIRRHGAPKSPGSITVNVNKVTSRSNHGINVGVPDGDVLITATGRITGAKTGIRVTSAGSGAVSVNASGALTGKGASDSAFFASLTSLTASSAINVNLATVTAEGAGAGAHGILVQSSARGDVSVTATGAVAASGGHGIFIDKSGTGTGGVSVTTSGNVTGAKTGIRVDHGGRGAVSVRAAGAVTGKGSSDSAVRVSMGSGNTSAARVSVATVTAQGTGALSDRTRKYGIDGKNADDVVGGHGILVVRSRDGITLGDISVSSTGRISAAGGHGIFLWDMSLAGGQVVGGLSATATGEVSASVGHGIYVVNDKPVRWPVTVSAGTVGGGMSGIRAVHHGYGPLSIRATGAVTGRGTATGAVFASATGVFNPLSVTVNVAAVTAEGTGSGAHAIYVRNRRGDVSVTAAGLVTSKGGSGIYINKRGTGTGSVSVVAGGGIASKGAAIRVIGSGAGSVPQLWTSLFN